MVKKEDNVLENNLKIAEAEKLPLEEWPLTSLREYRLYNEEARKMNKKLRICRYPIKQCPVELHPKQKVKFGNNDKTTHPVPVYLSNHLIHFDMKLIPGKVYELPECIISYLSDKGYPVWAMVEKKDGTKESMVVNKTPRFSLTTIYEEQQWG